MEKHTELLSVAEAMALLSAGTILTTIVYVLGYSFSSRFPVYSFVSIDDLLVLALPWLIPNAAILIGGLIVGITSARAGIELESTYDGPPRSRAATVMRGLDKYALHVVFLVTAIGFTAIVVKQGAPLYAAVPTWAPPLFMLWFDFLHKTRWGREVAALGGRRYLHAVALGPVALSIALTTGLADGSTGGRYFLRRMDTRLELRTGEAALDGQVAFSLREFILVRHSEDLLPILIPKSDIVRIHPFSGEDDDEGRSILNPKDAPAEPEASAGDTTEQKPPG